MAFLALAVPYLVAAGGYAASVGSFVAPYVMPALSLASAGVSVYSGYQQARAERAMGKAQQRLATYNGQVAEAQAKTELQSGNAALRDSRIRAEQIRGRNRYIRASQQAAMAKSGIVATEGTPLLVSAEAAMESKLESLDEIWKGQMEKREHVVKAGYYTAQAKGSYMEGLMARKASSQKAKGYVLSGWGDAVGSLGSAFGSLYKTWGSQTAKAGGGGGNSYYGGSGGFQGGIPRNRVNNIA